MWKSVEPNELKSTLLKQDLETLADLVVSMLAARPDLTILVECTLFGGGQGPGEQEITDIRRRAKEAVLSVGWDYHALRRAGPLLRNIKRVPDSLLDAKRFDVAATAYEALIDGVLDAEYWNRRDDEGGVSSVLHDCFEALVECMQPERPNANVSERVIQRLFDMYCYGLEHTMDWMTDIVGRLVREELTLHERNQLADRFEAVARSMKDPDSKYRRESLCQTCLRLKESSLSADEYLELARSLGQTDEVLDRLLELGRVDEAMAEAAGKLGPLQLATLLKSYGFIEQALREATSASRGPAPERALDWLLEHAESVGDTQRIIEYSRRLFLLTHWEGHYFRTRQLAQQVGTWAVMRGEMLGHLSARGVPNTVRVNVYLSEGMAQEALESFKQSPGSVDVELRLRLAEACEAERPDETIRLFRKTIDEWVPAGQNYENAAALMRRLRNIYERLGRLDEWSDYYSSTRKKHSRRYHFISALKREGLQ